MVACFGPLGLGSEFWGLLHMALDFMGDWAYTILHPPKHSGPSNSSWFVSTRETIVGWLDLLNLRLQENKALVIGYSFPPNRFGGKVL